MIVAGVVIETVPGAVDRVAAAVEAVEGLVLHGNDGDRRLAGVWTGADGAALERAASRLVAGEPEVLGVFPTFVGDDET